MDVERAIELLVEQQVRMQAKMDSYIEEHKQAHLALESDLRQVAKNQLRQQEMIGDLIRIMTDLGIAQRNLQESQRNLQQEVAESRKDTDQRLNALIQVVDDLIRRNGRVQ